MSEKKKYLKIKFHSFRNDGCSVDVDLSFKGKTVRDIKLIKEADGRLSINLPAFLKGEWTYKEITLKELYSRITAEYNKFIGGSEKKSLPQSVDKAATADKDKEPVFTFSSLDTKITALADITFQGIALPLKGVFIQGNLTDNTVFVKKPSELAAIDGFDEKQWHDTAQEIEKCFRKRYMDYTEETAAPFEIRFYGEGTFYTCLADVHFPDAKRAVGGFLVKIYSNGKVEIKLPSYIKEWDDSRYALAKLRRFMSAAVLEKYPVVSEELSLEAREKVPKKETTPSGRIANAENSDFRYITGSVLVDDGSVPESSRKNIHILAAVITKGDKGGIGPFEFGVLKWVARLRYATTVMIQELTYYGYIDTGWREKIKRDKYPDIIKRMLTFDMLQRSRFGALDEEGNIKNESYSVSKVLTVGKNGGSVLKEFSVDGSRYNSFDTIRDAHTVKSCLTVNQWLIYWLGAFKGRVGDNFDNSFIIKRIGAETTAAKLYATVQLDDKVLVGEAVRRCAENAKEVSLDMLRNKLERMIDIFDHPDETYRETKKISYPSRPVINLICEDDEHIKEVYGEIKDIMDRNPLQQIWFTHDLRVFNEQYIGQRFICMDSGEPVPVSLSEVFGADDEAEAARLRKMFTKAEEKDVFDSEDGSEETDEGETSEDGGTAYPDAPDEYSAEEYGDDEDFGIAEDTDTDTEEDYGIAWN